METCEFVMLIAFVQMVMLFVALLIFACQEKK